MGKIRDLFKTIRDTKGTFLAKIGEKKKKKDRNSMDLTEADDIKKKWKNIKRVLMTQIITVVSSLT